MRVELLEYSVKKNNFIQLNIADLSMTIWFLFVCLFSFIHSFCYLVHFRFSHRCQRSEKRSQNAIPQRNEINQQASMLLWFLLSDWFGNTRKKRAKNRITEENGIQDFCGCKTHTRTPRAMERLQMQSSAGQLTSVIYFTSHFCLFFILSFFLS